MHLFLGQNSGWHLLQSSFNFSFTASNLNDLNGFLILSTSFFCIEKWESYKLIGNKNDLFISLIIISLVFLFPFIASPSPDLPTTIIVTLIIYFFIESFQKENSNHINLITVLTLLVILIKVTVAPILILLLIILIKTKDLKKWRLPFVLSLMSLSSFIIKNIVITGYPLYPLSIGNELINVDWKLNYNLQLAYYQWTSMYGWQMYNWEEFCNLSLINKFWIWLNLPKLNGLLNKLILLLMFLFLFLTNKKKEMRYLYIFFIIQFIVFYTTSPQYRFFLPFLLSIALLISAHLLHKRFYLIKLLFALNLILLTLLGVFGLNVRNVTNNNIMSVKHHIIPSQVNFPRSITQFEDLEFIEYEIQNLKYFSPSKDSLFFWQTSNGPLPCVNKDMIDYFSTYYNHIPQLRTKNIKDGFLSSKPD
nr:hypothetical protein [Lacinutrix jangbogonensis]